MKPGRRREVIRWTVTLTAAAIVFYVVAIRMGGPG